jgi:signal transduction histidine kinase
MPQAQRQGVAIELEAPSDLPEAEADPGRIEQVLDNLMSNALRYTPAGGRLVLSAEANGDKVSLRVEDSGAGIPSEELPYIFERFYRADKARQRHEGETGLGLAIARSIVEAHGGSVSVESALGKGTTFTIALPTA